MIRVRVTPWWSDLSAERLQLFFVSTFFFFQSKTKKPVLETWKRPKIEEVERKKEAKKLRKKRRTGLGEDDT